MKNTKKYMDIPDKTPDLSFTHSDLAAENITACHGSVDITQSERDGLHISRLTIDSERLSREAGKPRGNYVTVDCSKIWEMDNDEISRAAGVISDELKLIINKHSYRIDEKTSVLIVGLGNRNLTSDAIGPETIDGIEITAHIKKHLPDIFASLGKSSVMAIAPGVLGQTGIEAADTIKNTVRSEQPDLVIVIDSLAARSTDRLGTTVQITDSGLSPGAGIGNERKRIDCNSIGKTVISLGVPTVVSSSALVYDALGKAGITDISGEFRDVLEKGRNFIVSPKESDTIKERVSLLLSSAINMLFTNEKNVDSSMVK